MIVANALIKNIIVLKRKHWSLKHDNHTTMNGSSAAVDYTQFNKTHNIKYRTDA